MIRAATRGFFNGMGVWTAEPGRFREYTRVPLSVVAQYIGAVEVSGVDLVDALHIGRDLPWPAGIRAQVDYAYGHGKQTPALLQARVTWYGDHARYLAGNWPEPVVWEVTEAGIRPADRSAGE